MPEILGKHWISCGTSRTKLKWTPIGRIAFGKTIRRSFIRTWMGESTDLGMFVCSWRTRAVLIGIRGRQKMSGKKEKMVPMRKNMMKHLDLDEPTSFLDHVYLGCTQRGWKPNETIIEQYKRMSESCISAGATEKLPGWETLHAKIVAWSFDMEGHARKCVERYLLGWPSIQTRRIWISGRTTTSVLTDCLKKCIWHELEDQTSCGLSANLQEQLQNYRQYCHVGNKVQHCRLGLFQDTLCWRLWGLETRSGPRRKSILRVQRRHWTNAHCRKAPAPIFKK